MHTFVCTTFKNYAYLCNLNANFFSYDELPT